MNIYEYTLRGVSLSNKYLEWYFDIIHRASKRPSSRQDTIALIGYVESHHILPRSFSLGGEKDRLNKVYLTSKEHILAHMLLIKFSTDERYIAALRAYHCVCFKDNGGQNKRRPTLTQLAKARNAISIANKGLRGIRGIPSWSTHSSIEDLRDELQSLVKDNISDLDIGRRFGVSSVAIRNWRVKLGIPNRRQDIRNPDRLYELYVNQCLSAGEIGKIVGCSSAAVQQYLNRYGIPIRQASVRQQLKHMDNQTRMSKYSPVIM